MTLLAYSEQQLAATGKRLIEPSRVHPILEADRVEVGLVGQLQHCRWTCEADQAQVCTLRIPRGAPTPSGARQLPG